jgi:hypothetical protein
MLELGWRMMSWKSLGKWGKVQAHPLQNKIDRRRADQAVQE